MRNIYEVLELGPIVAQCEENRCLITINGSHLNFWVEREENLFENTDCRSFSETKLGELSWTAACELAEQYLKEIIFEATVLDEDEE